MKRHTFVVTVEDVPGVLNRISSLFRRRGFNIESLTVGHTERPGVSRMTFVVLTDEAGAERFAGAPLQAGERHVGGGHHRPPGGLPRARDDQGDGAAGTPAGDRAPGRGLPRAHHRPRAGLADHRNHRRRGQDRRAGRRAAALRRRRDGAHRPAGDDAVAARAVAAGPAVPAADSHDPQVSYSVYERSCRFRVQVQEVHRSELASPACEPRLERSDSNR